MSDQAKHPVASWLMDLLAAIAFYLRVARQLVRVGLIRKSQFRADFFIQVFMDTCWYASHIAIFEVLFQHTPEIAGWDRADIRILLGFLFISDAFMMVWLGNGWHFGRELKDGKLDPVRVRPISPIFFYFFQRFSLEGTVNFLMAASYLTWGLSRHSDLPNWPALTGFVAWSLVLAFWTRTVLTVLFSTIEFYLLNSDLSHFIQEFFVTPVDRPLDIFPKRIRWFLLTLMPVGVLSYLPASLVLGRISVASGLLFSVWLLVFGCAVFRFWLHSFKRYESAMG